jgi:dGTPase
VYSSEALAAERQKSTAMIAELFQFLVEDPSRLPDHHRELSETAPIHRVVCDYIAGMTDGFLQRTYDQTLGSRVQ